MSVAARLVLGWLLFSVGGVVLGEDASPQYQSRTLSAVLADLQNQGLSIVYSSALVGPEMVVEREPEATNPLEVLEEVLRPHGLTLQQGPEGYWVIVAFPQGFNGDGPWGAIEGVVYSEGGTGNFDDTSAHLGGVERQAKVSPEGKFLFLKVPPGEYALEVRSPGYLPRRVEGVRVEKGAMNFLRIDLDPAPTYLHEIVVTPSLYRILETPLGSSQVLSREEVDRMPHLGDDLYRAIKRLPGVSGNDFSAQLRVRGGEPGEVSVILDGLELYEPFHLKDFQSVFSIIDAEAVGGVNLYTGGFPAEYGDRLSGVMDVSLATPSEAKNLSLGLGSLNGRVLSQGGFEGNRGRWLVSARGWYPEVFLEKEATSFADVFSNYYDVLAHTQIPLGAHSNLSANVIAAYDNLGFSREGDGDSEEVTARDWSHHAWFNLQTSWTPNLSSQTVAAIGRVKKKRVGGAVDEEQLFRVRDVRDFRFFEVKQDWTLSVSERQLLKWGVDVKHQDADYNYSALFDGLVLGGGETRPEDQEESTITLGIQGDAYGAYVAHRFRLTERITTELGLRWDLQSWTNDFQLSPRMTIGFQVNAKTELRAAWGKYYQSQRLNELQIEDGESTYHRTQLAEHWLISLERQLDRGLGVRLEAYYKDIRRPRPRFENLFNPVELFPESKPDRIRVVPEKGRAAGIELLLKQNPNSPFTWWLSYVLSRAEDRFEGEWTPRSWDQRHALSFGLNWNLPRKWNLNLAGAYHSGWPTTGLSSELGQEGDAELVFGPRNRERFPHYRRLDLRVMRDFPTKHGEFTLIFEVINLTNRKNICCKEDIEIDAESGEVIVAEDTWAPIIPTLGLRWRF